jgi:NADH-quinone oxidoreductase subunit J
METLAFVGIATVVLTMALAVVLAHSPLRSALALIVVQCALAGLYVLLHAPFVAAMQVLVYAGAIMVLFLFVIMLLNLGNETLPQMTYLAAGKGLGALSLTCICVTATTLALATPLEAKPVDGSVTHVGAMLLGPYLLAFEATSVLLLTAVLGSIVLNLKRLV